MDILDQPTAPDEAKVAANEGLFAFMVGRRLALAGRPDRDPGACNRAEIAGCEWPLSRRVPRAHRGTRLSAIATGGPPCRWPQGVRPP
jgi:hypothetical protein